MIPSLTAWRRRRPQSDAALLQREWERLLASALSPKERDEINDCFGREAGGEESPSLDTSPEASPGPGSTDTLWAPSGGRMEILDIRGQAARRRR